MLIGEYGVGIRPLRHCDIITTVIFGSLSGNVYFPMIFFAMYISLYFSLQCIFPYDFLCNVYFPMIFFAMFISLRIFFSPYIFPYDFISKEIA